MKVYCKNCIHCKKGKDLYFKYTSSFLRIKGDRSIDFNQNYCIVKMEKLEDIKDHPLTESITKYVLVNKLTTFNKNNDCIHYKEKGSLIKYIKKFFKGIKIK